MTAKDRDRLERLFMFAPRRSGAALVLVLLDLADCEDEYVAARRSAWAEQAVGLLGELTTGHTALDGLPTAALLSVLIVPQGCLRLGGTTASDVLEAAAHLASWGAGPALSGVRKTLQEIAASDEQARN